MDAVRRSLLYVPALDEAVLRKAPSRGADVLVVDLEDSVLPDAKDAARARAAAVWNELGPGERFLRVNAAGTPWHDDDLEIAALLRPTAVVVPKAEDPDDLARVAKRVAGPVAVMIETARGVLAAPEIAWVPGVMGLLFGAADFRRSVRATPSPDESELLVARSTIVLAARAAGLEAWDTPWFELRDAEGLIRAARRARGLGFDGKAAIHPGQLGAIHDAFRPSGEEVQRAEAVLRALADAAAVGRGVAVVDGEMVEPLHGAEAERTLRLARLPDAFLTKPGSSAR